MSYNPIQILKNGAFEAILQQENFTTGINVSTTGNVTSISLAVSGVTVGTYSSVTVINLVELLLEQIQVSLLLTRLSQSVAMLLVLVLLQLV